MRSDEMCDIVTFFCCKTLNAPPLPGVSIAVIRVTVLNYL